MTVTPSAPEPSPEKRYRGKRARTRHRAPRRRWPKILAAAVVVLLLVGVGIIGVVYEKFNSNITSVSIGNYQRPQKTDEDVHGNTPLNILIMGSDTRAGADGTYGANDHAPLSDSTMLVHVDAERTAAWVISIPRDTMVARPSCPGLTGGTVPAENPVMFNTALAVGGPACTVHTVENLTGLYIDHFIEADFEGFKRMVDAVDGVNVCLPNTVRDWHSKLYLTKGRHHIDGATALAFMRERYDIGDGSDLGRIKLQQQLLGSLITQMHSDRVLYNPAKLYTLGNVATQSITTDSQLASVADLLSLAKDLRSVPPAKVSFLTTPVEPYAPNPDRLQEAQPAARQLWTALRSDTLGQKTASPSPSASASPAPNATQTKSISLVVLNGTTTTGKAQTAATSLRSVGYQVSYVGNAGNQAHSTTVIEYPAGMATAAKTVQASIPGATLQQTAGLTSVTVVIGNQFSIDKTGAPAKASPSPAATLPSTIPTRVATTDVCTAS